MQNSNYAIDILNQKNSEKNLVQSFSEIILASLPYGITILNVAGDVVFINEAAKKILHSPHIPIKTQKLITNYEIYDEKGNKLFLQDLPSQKALRTKKPQQQLLKFWHKNIGIESWVEIKSQPLIENNTLIGIVNVYHDLTELKKSQTRLTFLNTLSEKLTSSLNYDQRLKRLAEQIVPTVSDWCAIDMLSASERLERLVTVHQDSKKIRFAQKLYNQFPPDPQSSTGVYGVLKTGKAQFFPLVTETMIREQVQNITLRDLLLKVGLTSIVMLPLITRNKKIGVITFAQSESKRQFIQEDIGFLKNIASKAALLCDNGRMYTSVLQNLMEKQRTEQDLRDSRNTLSLALDASRMGVWDWDIKTNSLNWSRQLEAIHKLQQGSFKKNYAHFLSLIDSQDKEKFESDIQQAFHSLKHFKTEYRLKKSKRNDQETWIYGTGELLLNEQGKPVRMIGIGMDISQRKKYEADIIDREAKFRSIFNSVTEAMFITNDKGIILETNNAGGKLFKLTPSDNFSQHFKKLLDTDSLSDFSKCWKEMMVDGESQCELSANFPGGQKTFDVLLKKHVISSQNLIVLRDVTDLKYETRRREHFLSIASHELRSPLANLKVYLELLKKLNNDTEGRSLEYIVKSEQKVDMVTKLISDLLDVTRIREGKLELYFEIVDAQSYIKSLLKELQLVINGHTIISTHIDKGAIVIDKIRIAQVITNLVVNAAKYSDKNTPITVNSKIENDHLAISVRDKGSGIEKKDIPALFTIYNQGNAINRSGLGLGLYIAKQIVVQHKGYMRIKSKRGKGSTFTFTLPLRHEK